MLGGDDVEQVEEVLQQHAVRPRQGGHEAGGQGDENQSSDGTFFN